MTNITVCSLTVGLVKADMDIAKANISNVEVQVKTRGWHKEVKGKLGSISLLDLTLHGQIYKERFLTSGNEALQFKYIRYNHQKSNPNYPKAYVTATGSDNSLFV